MSARPRILPFDQPGTFHYRRAQKRLDQQRYLDALQSLRSAVQKDPDNPEYQLDLAEIFTEMCCFDESNQVLFALMRSPQSVSECYFGLGCNFMGLQDFEKARESFLTYIRLDPDGTYRDDVEDLLDTLQEARSDLSDMPGSTQAEATRGKALMDSGEYQRAAAAFRKALKGGAEFPFLRNNLALCYYLMGQQKKAVKEAQAALSLAGDNLHALCNLALFSHEAGEEACALACAEKAGALALDDPDDLHKYLMTLCEIGRSDTALARVPELVAMRPYDKRALHFYASLFFNAGKTDDAEEMWQRIVRIDPLNSIAPFYLSLCREWPAGRANGRPVVPHAFQVPHQEVLRRIRAINELARHGLADMTERWQGDESFRSLLLWGLNLSDAGIRRALYQLVSVFQDREAQRVLQSALTSASETDENKREVFGMLKQMGAPEPYIATIDGSLVEVRVSVLGSASREMPAQVAHVLQTALQAMSGRYEEAVLRRAPDMLCAYWRSLSPDEEPPGRAGALCAALEYACVRASRPLVDGEKVDMKRVAAWWGVSRYAMQALSSRIYREYLRYIKAQADQEAQNDDDRL